MNTFKKAVKGQPVTGNTPIAVARAILHALEVEPPVRAHIVQAGAALKALADNEDVKLLNDQRVLPGDVQRQLWSAFTEIGGVQVYDHEGWGLQNCWDFLARAWHLLQEQEYVVTWSINVTARSPHEAAMAALAIQLNDPDERQRKERIAERIDDPDAAVVFDVEDSAGNKHEIDLAR